MKKEYKCICGFICHEPQKYNAHLRHCETYLRSVGKYEKMQEANRKAAATGRAGRVKQQAEQKQLNNELWISEKHTCERCGEVMTEKFGSGRFCSRACANARHHSEETKAKISRGVLADYKKPYSKPNTSLEYYMQNPKMCSVCSVLLPYEKRFRKTCSDECFHVLLSTSGKSSASVLVKRSKNEMAFCDLCESYFGKESVLHNVPMFNGWDADVIIPKYKLAILWNGPWHYKKITAKHSLEQVQNRDRLKINEIIRCGFTPYVIEDHSKFSDNKVLTEFNNLLAYIDSLNINELL